MVLSRLSLRRLAPVSVSAAHAARARAAAHQGVVRIAGAQSTVRFASTGDKKQGDDEDAAQHAAKAAKDKKEESQKPQEEQQQQQQQQASSLASGAGSEAKEQKEELRGPIRKLVDLFHHLKSQVTEDNVHYDRSKPYQAPVDRRRSSIERPAKAIEENKDATGVVMHKESRWESQWKNFKDTNPVVSGFFGLQERFDESDNILVRGARSFTDTISDRFRGMFDDDESAAVLAEIRRIDPTFDRLSFSLHLEKKVIPAVLEAFVAGDLDPLKEWCAEPCFKSLESLIEHRKQAGLHLESRILDISNVEFLMAKRMDEGLVMIFSFHAQQTKCVRDRTGKIVEGGEDNIEQSIYIFAMRRDPNVFDPLLAWQVLEIGEQHSQPII